MVRRWASTVRVLSTSCSATSRLVRPAATSVGDLALAAGERAVAARRARRGRRGGRAAAAPAPPRRGGGSGAEAVERRLGGDQRLDAASRPGRGECAALGEPARARASGAPAALLACGDRGSDRLGRIAAREQRARSGPRRSGPRRRRLAAAERAAATSSAPAASAASARSAAAAGRSAGRTRASRAPKPASSGGAAVSALPAAVSAAPRHQPGWPAAWKSGAGADGRRRVRVRERRSDVAGSEPGGREAAVRPQQHPRVAAPAAPARGRPQRRRSPSAIRPSSTSAATDSMVSMSRTALAAGLGGDRGAALERRRGPRSAGRAPRCARPRIQNAGQPDGELLRA